MKVLYFSATGRRERRVDLPESVGSFVQLCQMLHVCGYEELEARVFAAPYDNFVLIVPNPPPAHRLHANRAMSERHWDLCFVGDAVIATMDGSDVPSDFDPLQCMYHPFSLYEMMDYKERLAPNLPTMQQDAEEVVVTTAKKQRGAAKNAKPKVSGGKRKKATHIFIHRLEPIEEWE